MQTQYITFSKDVIWSQHSMEKKKAFSLLWCTKENGHGLGLGTVVGTRKFQNTHRSAL